MPQRRGLRVREVIMTAAVRKEQTVAMDVEEMTLKAMEAQPHGALMAVSFNHVLFHA